MAKKTKHTRNGNLYDKWSIVHLSTGVLMGWIMHPALALCLMILWEPLEIFVLSPILDRYGVVFGFESLRNSLSDIVFDAFGVFVGSVLVAALLNPPFHLV